MRHVLSKPSGRIFSALAFLLLLFLPPGVARASDPFEIGFSRSSFYHNTRYAISPSASILAAVGNNYRGLKILRLADRRQLDALYLGIGIEALAWSPDEAHLYIGGDGEIWRYTVATSAYQRVFASAELSYVLGLSVSPDGTKLAAVGQSNGIKNYTIIPTGTGLPAGPYALPNLEISKVQWAGNDRVVVNGPNVMNLTGQVTVANPSASRDFSVSPNGAQVAQILDGRVLRVISISNGAEAWRASLPSSLYLDWVSWFAGGSALAFADTDPSDRVAFQVFTANSAFSPRVRFASTRIADSWLWHMDAPPAGRKVNFVYRDSGWASVLTVEVAANLLSAIEVNHMLEKVAWRLSVQPTTIAPGTATSRPGVAYVEDLSGEPPTMTLRDGITADVVARLPRENGNSVRQAISPDGRYIAYAGRRESGGSGFHLYRTSDNTRIGSFESSASFERVDVGNNGVFAVDTDWHIRVLVPNLTTGVVTNPYSYRIESGDYDLSPEGTRVAIIENGTSIGRVYNTSNGALISTLPAADLAGLYSIQMPSAGRLFVLRRVGDQVVGTLWNVESATPTTATRIQVPFLSGDEPIGAVSPDLKHMLIAQSFWGSGSEANGRFRGRIWLATNSDWKIVQTWNDAMVDEGYRSVAFSTDSQSIYFSSHGTGLFSITLASSVKSVTLNPATVVGGNSSTGTVTLSRAVTAATTVQLTSSLDRATVPATVTVPAGSDKATFTVQTKGVNSNTTVRITAKVGTSTAFADLAITRATALTVNVTPNPVASGAAANGVVTLNGQAGPSGVAVALTSSVTGVGTVSPASVTVASGATSATFTFKAAASPTGPSTVVGASSSALGISGSRVVEVLPSGLTLTFDPSTTKGGSAVLMTIRIPQAAPTGGRKVNLASNSPALVVPASITIPAGKTERVFGVQTISVASTTNVTVTATSTGLATTTKTISVSPAAVNHLRTNATSVIAGRTAVITVVLDGAARTGLSLAATSSNTASGTVPATVAFTAGALTANLTFTSKTVTTPTNVSVTVGGKSVTVRVLPAP